MNFWRTLCRISRILSLLRQSGLLAWAFLYYPRGIIRFLAFGTPKIAHSLEVRAIALRETLVTLGPIFVKFGQMLSTRRDLLPAPIANELAKLQDQVPPFPFAIFTQILETTYGRAINEVFLSVEETSLGSASIAQVHGAVLRTGEKIVLKVLRPNIKEQIVQDITVLAFLARALEHLLPGSKRFRPKAVVAEFEATLLAELDLPREGASASQLRRNFPTNHLLYVPKIYWDYTTEAVLAMERIYGTPISHVEVFKKQGVDLKRLAENGVEIFFTQVFRDRFFHADMHPGNVFVDITAPLSPKYIAIDFGIMGTLTTQDQRYLAENFLAFFKEDYRRVAELHVASGWVPHYTRIEDLEAAIRTVCEPIFEKPLSQISFGHTLLQLFQVAQAFEMEVQPQLILLQKTLLTIEGIGRELYPDLDLWHTAKPYLERWMKERMSFRRVMKAIRLKLPFWVDTLTDPLQPLPIAIKSQTIETKQRPSPWPAVLIVLAGAGMVALGGVVPTAVGIGLVVWGLYIRL